MSKAMIDLAKQFIESKIGGSEFASKFFSQWRAERASGQLKADDKNLGSCLSELFSLADSYVDGEKVNQSDLTEVELRAEVKSTLARFKYI